VEKTVKIGGNNVVEFAIFILIALVLFLGTGSISYAEGIPWSDHLAPFEYLFGNSIYNHQQTKPMPNGGLTGFLSITFTGEYTEDGVPIFRHSAATDPENEISVGWQVRVVPAVAKVVNNQEGDHPIWLIDDPNDIPQPGSYSHFHWLDGPMNAMDLNVGDTYGGYILELTAKKTFAFRHDSQMFQVINGKDLVTHTNIVTSFPGFSDGGDTGDGQE